MRSRRTSTSGRPPGSTQWVRTFKSARQAAHGLVLAHGHDRARVLSRSAARGCVEREVEGDGRPASTGWTCRRPPPRPPVSASSRHAVTPDDKFNVYADMVVLRQGRPDHDADLHRLPAAVRRRAAEQARAHDRPAARRQASGRMRLALALALAAALAGQAAAANAPIARHTAKDTGLARRALIGKADVGKGWQPVKAAAGRSTLTCKAANPSMAGIVETGTAAAGFRGGAQLVAQVAWVFRTPRAGRDAVAACGRQELPRLPRRRGAHGRRAARDEARERRAGRPEARAANGRLPRDRDREGQGTDGEALLRRRPARAGPHRHARSRSRAAGRSRPRSSSRSRASSRRRLGSSGVA